jgi:hypothetical protein
MRPSVVGWIDTIVSEEPAEGTYLPNHTASLNIKTELCENHKFHIPFCSKLFSVPQIAFVHSPFMGCKLSDTTRSLYKFVSAGKMWMLIPFQFHDYSRKKKRPAGKKIGNIISKVHLLFE